VGSICRLLALCSVPRRTQPSPYTANLFIRPLSHTRACPPCCACCGVPAMPALQPPEMQKKMKNVMRGVSLLIPALSTALPASVFMYWTGGPIGGCGEGRLRVVWLGVGAAEEGIGWRCRECAALKGQGLQHEMWVMNCTAHS
jgi:hypothetical protein